MMADMGWQKYIDSLEPDDDDAMELSEFLPLYREDDNRWWMLSLGDAQNLFDEAVERMEAAEALVAELQSHQDGWMDRAFAAEAQLAAVRQYLDEAIGRHAPDVSLIDRIVVLVSMLATNSTTPGGPKMTGYGSDKE